MIKKRSNFYPSGEIIDYKLPQSFQKTTSKADCGKWNALAVKDNYICHSWRLRQFKR